MLDYGIVGNCKTCALVKKDTSVDWMCFPDFDSPSVFGKILDDEKGGFFRVSPTGEFDVSQEYDEFTAVLTTTFSSRKAKFKVVDFFPRYRKILPSKRTGLFRQNCLVRLIMPVRGKPELKINYDPRPGYAKFEVTHKVSDDLIWSFAGDDFITLKANIDYLALLKEEKIILDKTLFFVVGADPDEKYNVTYLKRLLSSTKNYWKKWVGTLNLPVQNANKIIRSAITLKLLTYSQTGAIVAAPTTSIPEEVGSPRTWDYRFCWVRDAAFTVSAFKKIGRDYEARKLIEFMFDYSLKQKQPLQLMYGIRGERKLTERTLEHLNGFYGSKPVRTGNAAYNQKQNDIYGSLVDLIYMYYVFYEYETKLKRKHWDFLKYLVSEIEHNWKKPDQGIWEFRGQKQHFIYSKLMCFVGMNYAMRTAQHFGHNSYAEKWALLRDEIKNDMLKQGWNETRRAFTIFYGSNDFDAAALKMSYHDFLEHDDPRLINTILMIDKHLRTGPLVHRYKIEDDFGKSHSTFTICSFWLVDALYKIGREDEAREMYAELSKCSNHLGLYAEDLTVKTRENIGNFPQAYTHIALISSSLLLSEWNTYRMKPTHKSRNVNKKKQIK
ncbi:MAG: glycoside hydrolase family 15 protein [Candidatus Woesearchaeota archaeon]